MSRQPHFQAMFDLPVGATMIMAPQPRETVEAALRRLKLRGSKWGRDGRAYRMKVADGNVVIQRLAVGRHLKHADWWLLSGGARLLLKERPDPADLKKAKATADYLNGTRWLRDWEKAGSPREGYRDWLRWKVEIDHVGRLVATCVLDEATANGAPLVINPEPRLPWGR